MLAAKAALANLYFSALLGAAEAAPFQNIFDLARHD
jgi:hypothetical protein